MTAWWQPRGSDQAQQLLCSQSGVTLMPAKRDHHTAGTRHRLNVTQAKRLLACFIGKAAKGCKMEKLPAMKAVRPGTECKLPDGTPAWNCKQASAKCYQDLLTLLAGALAASCFEGKRSHLLKKPADQFKMPQVVNANIAADTECHMSASTGFTADKPFAKDVRPGTSWYTSVTLGHDSDGSVVKVRAHVLIAAARFGVPNSLGLPAPQKQQPLHLPWCHHDNGGCLNPLHIRWGNPGENNTDHRPKQERWRHGAHIGNCYRSQAYNASSSQQPSQVIKTASQHGMATRSNKH
ncbi:TPA: hypothetical protein ACH3X2_008496 [Trebouxia sp. C0005]